MTAFGADPKSPKVSHNYEQVLQRFGRLREIPDDYEPPANAEFLWWLFWHFSHRRKSGDGNSFAIEYGEIFAYMSTTGEVLSPIEVDIIIAMDDAFRKQLAETRDDQRKFNEKPSGKGPPQGAPWAKKLR